MAETFHHRKTGRPRDPTIHDIFCAGHRTSHRPRFGAPTGRPGSPRHRWWTGHRRRHRPSARAGRVHRRRQLPL